MNFSKLAIGIFAVGLLCLLSGPLTHSGIGSCGPYGSTGLLVLIGIFTTPLGALLMAGYWIYRGVLRLNQ
jgi:hypothetical protein